MDEDWKKIVDKEMKACNEIRARLEERDKSQQIQLNEAKEERVELYDHKNDIYNRIVKLESNRVSPTEFQKLSKCVNTLKTEKQFLPYLVMIITALAALGSLVCVIFKLGGH